MTTSISTDRGEVFIPDMKISLGGILWLGITLNGLCLKNVKRLAFKIFSRTCSPDKLDISSLV